MAAVWARANQIIWWSAERGERLGLQAAKFVGKASRNCLGIFPSAERKKRIQPSKKERKRGVREGKWNKGKEYGCRPVSEWIKKWPSRFPVIARKRSYDDIFVTSRWANRVEPHFHAFRNFAFPFSLCNSNLSAFLPFLTNAATPRLVNTICSSFIKHYSFPV